MRNSVNHAITRSLGFQRRLFNGSFLPESFGFEPCPFGAVILYHDLFPLTSNLCVLILKAPIAYVKQSAVKYYLRRKWYFSFTLQFQWIIFTKNEFTACH